MSFPDSVALLTSSKAVTDLKTREHIHADRELKLQREKYQEHQKTLGERVKLLEIRRQTLEEKRARYYKHIQDGKERCKAAQRRAKNELDVITQKESEIVALQEELNSVKEALQERREYSQRLIGYQDFLQAAVNQSGGEFETMEDLLSRYYILLQTKKDLKYHISRIQDNISSVKATTMQLRQNHVTELLSIGNKMSKIRAAISDNQQRLTTLEEDLEKLRVARRDRIYEEGTLKLATNNIYRILLQYRERAGLPKPRQGIVPDFEPEKQLLKIAEYTNDLRVVVKDVGLEGAGDPEDISACAVRASKPPLLV